VAKWAGCGETRIKQLRRWAQGGFVGTPFSRSLRRPPADGTLKTNDNFQDDVFEPDLEDEEIGGVEDPVEVLKNVLDTLKGMKALAEACRKVTKQSSLDSDAKAQIYNAIQLLIVKLKTVQSTLDKKG
jgi:hypothetical protein